MKDENDFVHTHNVVIIRISNNQEIVKLLKAHINMNNHCKHLLFSGIIAFVCVYYIAKVLIIFIQR